MSMKVKELLNKLGIKYIEKPVGDHGVSYRFTDCKKGTSCEIEQFVINKPFTKDSYRVNVEIGRSSFSTEGSAIFITRNMPMGGGSFIQISVGHFNDDNSIDNSDFYIEE